MRDPDFYNGAIWQGRHFTRYLIQWAPGGKQGDWMLLAFGSCTVKNLSQNFIPYNSRSYTEEEMMELLKSFGAKRIDETVDLVPRV